MTHGLFMILETLGVIKPDKFRWRWLGNLYTLFVVVATFVVFRADSISSAFGFLGAMFGFGFGSADMSMLLEMLSPAVIVTAVIAIVGCMPVIKAIKEKAEGLRAGPAVDATGYVLSCALLVLCVLALSASAYNPFIYFRF
jgi:alginate O-acetyltransferase complex protein AlgI